MTPYLGAAFIICCYFIFSVCRLATFLCLATGLPLSIYTICGCHISGQCVGVCMSVGYIERGGYACLVVIMNGIAPFLTAY